MCMCTTILTHVGRVEEGEGGYSERMSEGEGERREEKRGIWWRRGLFDSVYSNSLCVSVCLCAAYVLRLTHTIVHCRLYLSKESQVLYEIGTRIHQQLQTTTKCLQESRCGKGNYFHSISPPCSLWQHAWLPASLYLYSYTWSHLCVPVLHYLVWSSIILG